MIGRHGAGNVIDQGVATLALAVQEWTDGGGVDV